MTKKKKNNTSKTESLIKKKKSRHESTKKKSVLKKTSKTASSKAKTKPDVEKSKNTDSDVLVNNHQQLNKNSETSSPELQEKETVSTTENAQIETPKRKKRRKKGERTWEEKAKKLPVFEISNFPKYPVKKILITQAKPSDLQNPYQLLTDKYKVQINFRPFIKVEGLTAQEFRNQRVDVTEYSGIIFTSRLAVDHFFRIMNEMRVSIPENTKFFCMNEQIAYYMQKYTEFRKRRILWGTGTLDDFKNVIKKHPERKFLLPASDAIREKVIDILKTLNVKYTTTDVYKTVPENISDIKPEQFDMIVFFTPIAVEALHKHFPKFKQDKTRFAAYSILTANKLKELGYRVDIYAPTLEFPSMVNAIAHYLLHITEKK